MTTFLTKRGLQNTRKQRWISHLLLMVLLTVSNSFSLIGQEVYGYFSKDSIQIGEVIDYTLVCRHDKKMEVYFPDSLMHDFRPFEYVGQRVFPTTTQDSISVDSIIYQVRTFELDTIQSLSVPIFENTINPKKPNKYNPYEDEVTLAFELTQFPENLDFRASTTEAPVTQAINWVIIGGGLIVIALLIIVIWSLFGGKVKRYFIIKKMEREKEKFIALYNIDQQDIDIDKLLGVWKVYTGKVLNIPLSSYTTREIARSIPDKKLHESLQTIDQYIYGGVQAEALKNNMYTLKEIALNKHSEKIDQLKYQK